MIVSLLLLVACGHEDTPPGATAQNESVGVLGEGPMNPFPSTALVRDGHVALTTGDLPIPVGGTALDVRRFNWREGFSPVQPAIVRLHVELDATSLNDERDIGTGGAVRMVDLTTGTEIACFAELDLHPDALATPTERTLIVRPQEAMTPGHRVAVVLTRVVRTARGAPLDIPAWSEAQVRDPEVAALADDLAALGLDNVALAWEFPVGDGRPVLRAVLDGLPTPDAYRFTRIVDADLEAPGILPPGVWKKIEGRFTAANWLVDDTRFEVGDDGLPRAQVPAEAYLYVHVPESVRGAAPGSVPVLLFGHGILGEPGDYLDDDADASRMIALSERLGAIVVATTWRGLTEDDQPEAIVAALDFGGFDALTDKLAQGVANTASLVKLLREGPLLDDPELGGVANRADIRSMGISLGGIEGAVTLANVPEIERGVLHVGGSAWSTMLERSSNWPVFELLVVQTVPDPWDRQLLYAASQVLWDPVDPASWTAELAGRPLLYQEAIGDNQVPNLTTELLARSVGTRLASPSITQPWALDTTTLPDTGPVLVQFDPQTAAIPPGNRPASNTQAHNLPRTWDGTLAQTEGYLRTGVVEHHCGDAPCSSANTGE
jgi:hypothetical protein